MKRFTSRHIEMTMLTKDDDSMNLVVFDNNNLIIIPDDVTAVSTTQLTIDLFSYGDIGVSNWRAVVVNTGANAMGILNALLVPWIALTFSWQVAVASGAIFSILALVLLMFVRADQPINLD